MVNAMQINAVRKTMSAMRSIFSDLTSSRLRMERKDKRQLTTSSMAATPVISSMTVAPPVFDILIEVMTMRQKPNRLEEVLSI